MYVRRFKVMHDGEDVIGEVLVRHQAGVTVIVGLPVDGWAAYHWQR